MRQKSVLTKVQRHVCVSSVLVDFVCLGSKW